MSYPSYSYHKEKTFTNFKIISKQIRMKKYKSNIYVLTINFFLGKLLLRKTSVIFFSKKANKKNTIDHFQPSFREEN